MMMKKICVFCGSRVGVNPVYATAARTVGRLLAQQGLGLVYGGGRVGLMGAVAQGSLDAGGHVTGVIPGFLNRRELLHPNLNSCHTVTDLFERKAMMLEIADGFLALPGGIGTLDELFEVVAWRQLRQLEKPIAILNTANYFEPWLQALQASSSAGFLDAAELDAIIVETTPEAVLSRLKDALAH